MGEYNQKWMESQGKEQQKKLECVFSYLTKNGFKGPLKNRYLKCEVWIK